MRRAHGTYQVSGKPDSRGKVPGKAKTLMEEVTDKKWKSHLDGSVGIGIVPLDDEGMSHFGAIDVDVYDLRLESLEATVQESGLPLILCRTKSGGAHLFLFTSEPVKASLIRDKLMEWAIYLGYPKVEVFPKQSEIGSENDVGSWINMPYFSGERTTRYAIRDGKALSPEEFLNWSDLMAVTEKKLKSVVLKEDDSLDGSPPCLQHLSKSGFPEGTRNLALYNIGVYCKMRHGDQWMDKAREMNQRYLLPPLGEKEVNTTLRALSKKEYFYKCTEPPIVGSCNKSICSRREFGIGRSMSNPGIVLDSLTKILTDPPMWHVNVNGKRVRLDSSEDLLSQRNFERICVDSHNIIPIRVADNVWRNLIRELMEKVEEVSAPEDAGPSGQFMYLLEKFCRERITKDSSDEILLEKVYSSDGRLYFCSAHLIGYMDRLRLKVTAKMAWATLREIGGDTHRMRIGGKLVRTWSIPSFEDLQVSFDVPKEIEEESIF